MADNLLSHPVVLRLKALAGQGLAAPIFIVMLLAMMILPLPAFALDVLFTFNITLSLVVLMVAIYSLRPLDFSLFPTLLLVATLLRLALNVASTRVVLLEGHTGTDAAGQVIEAFGAFVIGGNYAVGLVVFLILVIINFVVVTKGAGRVSEVSARFTLDAMPGKQMAIDADLNAGLIDQDTARSRREDVSREADFYGSMDGASKFVRGDAVAGILILFINIIGGLGVGMGQHGMGFGDAMHNYTLLTIGDGLVAQIPSLLLSTAAAIIVTRVTSKQEMGTEMASQLFDNPLPLAVTSGILGMLGIIPGMPNLAFLSLAAAGGGASWLMQRRRQTAATTAATPAPAPEPPRPAELGWDDLRPVDVIGLEVGYRLIPLVDRNQGGPLMDRIKGVRRKLSQELGFLVPSVHIRDNLDLEPNRYRITLHGVPVGEAEVFPEREMAINPGQVYGRVEGAETQDPAFGLPAIWIDKTQHDLAQGYGYTVVDGATVVATHLSSLLQQRAEELIGVDETQKLLDRLAESYPKLVEDLIPDRIGLPVLTQVLRNLLREQVPIRDLRTIVGTLAEATARQPQLSQDSGALTAKVRGGLSRMITQDISGLNSDLHVMTLDPSLEQLLLQSTQGTRDGEAVIEPGLAERLHQSVRQEAARMEGQGLTPALLVAPPLRPLLARLLGRSVSNLRVLAYTEVPDDKGIKVVAAVGGQAGLGQGGGGPTAGAG